MSQSLSLSTNALSCRTRGRFFVPLSVLRSASYTSPSNKHDIPQDDRLSTDISSSMKPGSTDSILNESQLDSETNDLVSRFCAQKMRLVSVLSSDSRTKTLVLHARFDDTPDKDAVVIMEKCSFPKEPDDLVRNKIVSGFARTENSCSPTPSVENAVTETETKFPDWHANVILSNDVYHRLSVTSGFDLANKVDVTVIHPAEKHHLKKYTASGRRVIHESPEMYHSIIVPFLQEKPPDLSWVDNILSGKAETDRVLFVDPDPQFGFTLVLDYRWDGRYIRELHCLAIAHTSNLTCLRDLRACHIPMLKRILAEGRQRLSAKYSTTMLESDVNQLDTDQIVAYVHYPPTFYRFHVHFIHVDAGDDGGTRAGRAHLLDEVIRNLEFDGDCYAKRTMTVYLHEESPMLEAVLHAVDKPSQATEAVTVQS